MTHAANDANVSTFALPASGPCANVLAAVDVTPTEFRSSLILTLLGLISTFADPRAREQVTSTVVPAVGAMAHASGSFLLAHPIESTVAAAVAGVVAAGVRSWENYIEPAVVLNWFRVRAGIRASPILPPGRLRLARERNAVG